MLEVEPTVSVDVQPPEVAETSRDQFAATRGHSNFARH